jgi:hypothetical protein
MPVRSNWAVAFLCGLALAYAARGQAPSEYEVKAAFLFNFSKFVEWPAAAFEGADDPIVLCVLGTNPFGNMLSQAVQGKKVNGREVVARELASLSGVGRCHVLFIASSEEQRLEEILGRMANRPILTVSDVESVVDRGAIIGLTMEEKKVRFEVNLISSRKAGLKLSSQLLKVAVRLIGQFEPGR